ncbi:MAG TPA: glutamate--cysteine ligase [Clostridiales bacterium UBA8960]|jgi:glutamate--cysteine ligase|nr:glutamate--cysteine ligase [Clostridiales bacterium UBA8960]
MKGRTKGRKYTVETYIEKQVAFFKENATPNAKLLGMEFEHFLLDRASLRSYDYHEPHGQHDLLRHLLNLGWDILLEEDGYLLGIEKEGSTITLEPGGQVEISLRPLETVKSIDAEYMKIMDEIASVMMENQILAGLGYHPVTKIDALQLLPKKRYGMMYAYFENNGAYCHNMMKGTAATQVSIDYENEADFIRKFRVANYLSPVISSLFDATPFFEGEPTVGRNMRARIWAETDVKRSKLIPGSLSLEFGFEDYVKYLLKLPPILLYTEGELVFSGEQTLEEALNQYSFDEKELEHHTSMVFPDVRLKKFIEIRMPDALPYPYNLAVASLIKALFYNETLLDKYYQKSRSVDDAWVESQNEALKQTEVNSCIAALDVHVNIGETLDIMSLKNELLGDVIESLTADEAVYLEKVRDIMLKDGSFTAYLQRLALSDPEAFRNAITIVGGKNDLRTQIG